MRVANFFLWGLSGKCESAMPSWRFVSQKFYFWGIKIRCDANPQCPLGDDEEGCELLPDALSVAAMSLSIIKLITIPSNHQGDFNCGASSQADFILNYFLSNFLSNSPFPPSLTGRLEQLKSPCLWWWECLYFSGSHLWQEILCPAPNKCTNSRPSAQEAI